jgi:endogenous inhibitor of DNA gyrase (YacG/DUF329 family)
MDAGRGGRVSGRWVELDLQPYSSEVVNCSVCGARIPRRYWDDGTGRPHCSPRCVDLGRRVERLRERYRVI